MKNNEIIAKNIMEMRVKYGYTQDFIAEYLGITHAAVSQYENDARTIPPDVVSMLAVLFDVEEYDLYEEHPEHRNIMTSFAFRAGDVKPSDMQTVGKFKKIIKNYINMTQALANGE